jgi:hypothetical protein
LSRSVEGTIAPSTVTAMKSHGGRTQVSTRAPRHDRYGLKRIDR